MRVLFAGPYPPAADGIGTYTKVLADGVQAAGHEVAVAALRPDPGGPDEVIGALARPGELQAAIDRFDPDVIHLQFAVPAFGPATLSGYRWLTRQRYPVVVTLHEVNRDLALLRGAGRLLYRRLAAHSDRIIVHTQEALATMTGPVGVAAGKAEVVPHFSVDPPAQGTDPDDIRKRFDLSGGERILLMFGFIHVDKGLDDLVRALAQMGREDPAGTADLRIAVAGTVRVRRGVFKIMEYRDRLHERKVRRLARRLGIADRLTFTGFVPDGDIAAWFEAAEVVVLPYRKAEQSGVANLARAYGVPVVATTAGGLAELFEGSPWTSPPGRPDLLARSLTRFLGADRDSRESRPAPAAAPDDLPSVVAATVSVYEKTRQARRRTRAA